MAPFPRPSFLLPLDKIWSKNIEEAVSVDDKDVLESLIYWLESIEMIPHIQTRMQARDWSKVGASVGMEKRGDKLCVGLEREECCKCRDYGSADVHASKINVDCANVT